MNEYPQTVKAALSETKSKFELAEALALEVPVGSEEKLSAALAAAVAAGGEERSIKTYSRYRLTALWVADNGGHQSTVFRWIPGLSFSDHAKADQSKPYADFAAAPYKQRRVDSPEKVIQRFVANRTRETDEAYAARAKANLEAARIKREARQEVTAADVWNRRLNGALNTLREIVYAIVTDEFVPSAEQRVALSFVASDLVGTEPLVGVEFDEKAFWTSIDQ